MVEYLRSVLKKTLPGFDPQHHTHRWYTPVVSTLRRLRQEDHEFKVLLSYVENVSPAWAVRDPISRKEKKWEVRGLLETIWA